MKDTVGFNEESAARLKNHHLKVGPFITDWYLWEISEDAMQDCPHSEILRPTRAHHMSMECYFG